MPILGRARQARDLNPQDQADMVETDLRDQPLKACPSHGAAGRLAEVIIDHQHAVIQPTERLGTGDEAILEAGGLLMREHLLRARLSYTWLADKFNISGHLPSAGPVWLPA